MGPPMTLLQASPNQKRLVNNFLTSSRLDFANKKGGSEILIHPNLHQVGSMKLSCIMLNFLVTLESSNYGRAPSATQCVLFTFQYCKYVSINLVAVPPICEKCSLRKTQCNSVNCILYLSCILNNEINM